MNEREKAVFTDAQEALAGSVHRMTGESSQIVKQKLIGKNSDLYLDSLTDMANIQKDVAEEVLSNITLVRAEPSDKDTQLNTIMDHLIQKTQVLVHPENLQKIPEMFPGYVRDVNLLLEQYIQDTNQSVDEMIMTLKSIAISDGEDIDPQTCTQKGVIQIKHKMKVLAEIVKPLGWTEQGLLSRIQNTLMEQKDTI